MSIDPEKLLFIFVVAVVVLGPERLPQAARTLGKFLGEVRKYTSSFQAEVKQVLAEPKSIIDAAVREAGLRDDAPTRANGAGPGQGASSSPRPLPRPANGEAAEAPPTPVGAPEPRASSLPGAPDDPALN